MLNFIIFCWNIIEIIQIRLREYSQSPEFDKLNIFSSIIGDYAQSMSTMHISLIFVAMPVTHTF